MIKKRTRPDYHQSRILDIKRGGIEVTMAFLRPDGHRQKQLMEPSIKLRRWRKLMIMIYPLQYSTSASLSTDFSEVEHQALSSDPPARFQLERGRAGPRAPLGVGYRAVQRRQCRSPGLTGRDQLKVTAAIWPTSLLTAVCPHNVATYTP